MEGAKYVVVEGKPVLGAMDRRGKLGGKLCEVLRKEDLGMGLYNGNECIRLAGQVDEQNYMTTWDGGISQCRQGKKGVGSECLNFVGRPNTEIKTCEILR